MRHCLPCLLVMLCCQLISSGAHSQIPKNEIALEDAAFNKAFASRPIPTVTGYPGHAFIDKKGQYRPGVINGIRDISDRNALTTLINR